LWAPAAARGPWNKGAAAKRGCALKERGGALSVDEDLSLLDENVRRLKIEYDVYFGGGSKRPPNDTDWRVQSLIKRYSDGHKMNFAQRFKFNSIVQRYAIYSDLWRQKLKIKEEGYRRPQDAVLGIQGMRGEQEEDAAAALQAGTERSFMLPCSDVEADHDKVQLLFQAMMEAKKKNGEAVFDAASFDSFKAFLGKKTEQIRKDYGCQAVEYSVEIQDGQVKLKAKAKI